MRNYFRITLVLLCVVLNVLHAQQLVPFLKGSEWKVYNKSTKIFVAGNYQSVIPATGGLLFVRQNDKWGAMDGTEKKVIPLDYGEVKELNRDVISARDAKGIHLFDTLGKPITKTEFTEAAPYKNNASLIVACNSKKKYGIIDSHGKVLLPFDYDFAPEHLGNFLIVGKKGPIGDKQVGLLDSNFSVLLPVSYSKIVIVDNIYFACHELKGDYVLVNQSAKELYRGEGEPIRMYANFILTRTEKKFGVYAKKTGKLFLFRDVSFYDVWDEQGLAAFSDNENAKTYFVNIDGDTNLVNGYWVGIQETYTRYFTISERDDDDDYSSSNKYGMIDWTGKLVLPIQYDFISSWNSTLCSAGIISYGVKGRETNYSLLDIATGKDMLGHTCQDIQLFPMGGIALKENGVYHLYDRNLKLQDTREYTQVAFSRGEQLFPGQGNKTLYPVAVKKTGNTARDYCRGYMDGNCHLVLQPIYRDVREVHDQYNNPVSFCALVGSIFDSTYSYPLYFRTVLMDCEGNRISDPQYTGVGSYMMNHYFIVSRSVQYEDEWRGLSGLMDTTGRIVIPANYDGIEEVRGGNGFVLKLNGRVAYADKNGKVITPMKYGNIGGFGTLLTAERNGYYGLLTRSGKEVLPFAYETIVAGPYLNGTLFRVKKGQREFYVSTDGAEFYEP